MAIQVAEKIKIIRKDNSGNGHYDTFRERIMFPIWDHYGNPIGLQVDPLKTDNNRNISTRLKVSSF